MCIEDLQSQTQVLDRQMKTCDSNSDIVISFAKGILWATSGYLKDGSRDFVQEAGGARRRRGPRLASASSNRSWQLSVADAVQEVPRRHLQTELMNPVIGGLEAPISRRTRGVLEPERVRHAI